MPLVPTVYLGTAITAVEPKVLVTKQLRFANPMAFRLRENSNQ